MPFRGSHHAACQPCRPYVRRPQTANHIMVSGLWRGREAGRRTLLALLFPSSLGQTLLRRPPRSGPRPRWSCLPALHPAGPGQAVDPCPSSAARSFESSAPNRALPGLPCPAPSHPRLGIACSRLPDRIFRLCHHALERTAPRRARTTSIGVRRNGIPARFGSGTTPSSRVSPCLIWRSSARPSKQKVHWPKRRCSRLCSMA